MAPQSVIQKYRHYQFRLVKEVDGARLVTYALLARATASRARDKTFDIFEAGSDVAALKRARDYSKRSVPNKGSLPGEFRGVVVVRHDTDQTKAPLVSMTKGKVALVNRRLRLRDTTVWLYYVDPKGHAYSLDPTTRKIGHLVRPIAWAAIEP